MIKTIAMLLVVLLAIPGMALAETARADAQLEARLAASTTYGAEVRLLQLERAITRAIMQGERIINYAQEQEFSEVNIDVMIEVVADLRALRVQVQEVDSTSETVVREFVALRQEANTLTQTFRRASHQLFSEDDVNYLRGTVRAEVDVAAEVRARDSDIRQRICAHNAQQVQVLLDRMGVQQASLVADVRSCDVSKDEAMLELRRLYTALEERRREAAQQEVNEYRARVRVQQIAEAEASAEVSQDLIDRRAAIAERERIALEAQLRERRAMISANISARAEDRGDYTAERDEDYSRDRTEDSQDRNTSVRVNAGIEVR